MRLLTRCGRVSWGWALLAALALFAGCDREALLAKQCAGEQDWGKPVYEERDLRPSTVLIARGLALKEGLVVWDAGAGTGYWTKRLAQAVGPTGTVVATDTNAACVDFIDQSTDEWDADTIQVRIGSPADPLGGPAQADRILLSNSVCFDDPKTLTPENKVLTDVFGASPETVLSYLHKGLKDDGRLVYYRDYDSPGCMTASTLLTQFQQAGFRLVDEADPRALDHPESPAQSPGQRCRVFAVFTKADS